jgi:hypothetical protein
MVPKPGLSIMLRATFSANFADWVRWVYGGNHYTGFPSSKIRSFDATSFSNESASMIRVVPRNHVISNCSTYIFDQSKTI